MSSFWIVFSILWCSSLQADPEDPIALFESGRFDDARAAFAQRLEAQPDDPTALYYLGRLTSEGGKSRRFFERVLAAHPEHDLADDALFELAEADYADPSGLYLSARRRYRQLLVSYPQSSLAARVLYRTGMTYLVMRQADSAAVVFQEALNRFPASGMAPYVRLGMVEVEAQRGRTAEALKAAEALLAGDPGPLKPVVLERIAALKKGAGPTAVEEADKKVVKGSRFWVQVGAFRNTDNLGELSARLVTAGFQVREEAIGEDGLRLLLVGPFPNRVVAGKAEARIEALEKLSCEVKERPGE